MIERRKGNKRWEIEGEKKHRTGAAAAQRSSKVRSGSLYGTASSRQAVGARDSRRHACTDADSSCYTTILLHLIDIIDSMCIIKVVYIVDCSIATKT